MPPRTQILIHALWAVPVPCFFLIARLPEIPQVHLSTDARSKIASQDLPSHPFLRTMSSLSDDQSRSPSWPKLLLMIPKHEARTALGPTAHQFSPAHLPHLHHFSLESIHQTRGIGARTIDRSCPTPPCPSPSLPSAQKPPSLPVSLLTRARQPLLLCPGFWPCCGQARWAQLGRVRLRPLRSGGPVHYQ